MEDDEDVLEHGDEDEGVEDEREHAEEVVGVADAARERARVHVQLVAEPEIGSWVFPRKRK